jgi:hypothetical protein
MLSTLKGVAQEARSWRPPEWVQGSGADVVGQELRGDQELVRLLLGFGDEKAHSQRIDALVGRCQLAYPEDIQDPIFEASSRRLLEHEFGSALGHDSAIDLGQLTGSNHPNPGSLPAQANSTLGAQAEKANAVVRANPKFVYFDPRR